LFACDNKAEWARIDPDEVTDEVIEAAQRAADAWNECVDKLHVLGKRAPPARPARKLLPPPPQTKTPELELLLRPFGVAATDLEWWLMTDPKIDPDGVDALVHNMVTLSMRLQMIAQKIDGR
jgi:hypothetical protein